jgi:hypothetical protein
MLQSLLMVQVADFCDMAYQNQNPLRKVVMRIRHVSSFIIAALVSCASNYANATITGLSFCDDGDGAIVCPAYNGGASDTMSVYGDQFSGPGHILATILTDTPLDPSLTIDNAIDNDTSFDWTSYVVDVFLNKNFTLSAISSANPAGWTGSQTIAPYLVSPNLWTAEIVYSGATPVNTIVGDPNNEFDFTYKVTFSGATSYSLTEQVTPVPEPGVLSLLLGAGLLLGSKVAKRR